VIEGGASAALNAPTVRGIVRCNALVGIIRRPIGVEACTQPDKLAIAIGYAP
jgi:hypothetical protein